MDGAKYEGTYKVGKKVNKFYIKKSMEEVFSHGVTDQNTMEISRTTIYKGWGFTLGMMAGNTKANGRIIRCMDEGYSLGAMEKSMMESM